MKKAPFFTDALTRVSAKTGMCEKMGGHAAAQLWGRLKLRYYRISDIPRFGRGQTYQRIDSVPNFSLAFFLFELSPRFRPRINTAIMTVPSVL
jgi:hypothetical protein